MADATDIAAAAASAVAGATGGVNAGASAATGDPWFKGIEPDVLGHMQTKGWDKQTPADAVAQAVKAHRELEKHLGVPADKLARLPADANDKDGWAALNARLGVPADKTAYNFATLKFADGSPLDEGFSGPIRDAIHAAGLRPEQATSIVSAMMQIMDASEAKEVAERKGTVDADIAKLHAEWGSNFETNDNLVGRMLAKLGAGPEVLDNMKNSLGVYKTMDFFLQLSRAAGEARYIEGLNPAGGGGLISPEQASARLAEIRNDPQWLARWKSGGAEERNEFDMLNRRVVEGRMARR